MRDDEWGMESVYRAYRAYRLRPYDLKDFLLPIAQFPYLLAVEFSMLNMELWLPRPGILKTGYKYPYTRLPNSQSVVSKIHLESPNSATAAMNYTRPHKKKYQEPNSASHHPAHLYFQILLSRYDFKALFFPSVNNLPTSLSNPSPLVS